MHPAFYRDIRISDAGRQELSDRTEEEDVTRQDLPPLLEGIFQLLEYRILQYRINNEHQSGEDPSEKSSRAFVLKQRLQSGQGRRRSSSLGIVWKVEGGFSGCHPGIDDPNRIRDEDGGAASDRAGNHRLERRES